MTGQETSTNSHIGGPSEDRGCIRKGQIDWVPAIRTSGEYELWEFQFRSMAYTYLSEDVYPKTEERRYAWINALIRAASLGKFTEMIQLLELLDTSGVRCEDLLKKLGEHFRPTNEVAKKKASSTFMSYQRKTKSLSEAVRELTVMVLECKKLGYKPDNDTLATKYESLLTAQELPLYRLYLKNDTSENESHQKTLRAIEELAKDSEASQQAEEGTPTFSGGAFGKRGGSGKGPRRQGYTQSGHQEQKTSSNGQHGGKKCTYCGLKCPASKGGPKEKCFAFGKECKKCQKIGHFANACKSKAVTDSKGKAPF